jgi:hypothetical protein
LSIEDLVAQLCEKSGETKAAGKKGNKVVVLVDEYDYPVLRALKDGAPTAIGIAETLAPFFKTIQSLNQ